MKLVKLRGVIWLVVLIIFSACGARGNSNVSDEKKNRPNIIFLLTDDHRWDAMGAMGNSIIQTPNLDALAKGGVLFRKAYVTTAICCVSRASILSGKYMSRHGINDFNKTFSTSALAETYPALLRKAGYKLGFIGKFGVGVEKQPDTLFDYWSARKEGQPPYEFINKSGKVVHHTDSVNTDISQFLQQFAGNTPFCLSVSFKAPHELDGNPPTYPVQERFRKRYENIPIPRPVTADPVFWDEMPFFFKDPKNIGRERWKPLLSTDALRQETERNYYRLITGVDEVVGNLRKQLEVLNIDKNTIIIFMGDNGFSLGEHGLEGKWFGFEESIRVPLLVYGASVPEDVQSDLIALNIDIAPTILGLAGVKVPASMQGRDLLEMLKRKRLERDEFFYEHTFMGSPRLPAVQGVVGKDFKYLRYFEHNYEQLFNTSEDPFETRDLARDQYYAKKLKEMKGRYEVLREQVK